MKVPTLEDQFHPCEPRRYKFTGDEELFFLKWNGTVVEFVGMNVVSGIYVKYVEDPNNNKDLNFNIYDHSYHIRQCQTSMEDIVHWANEFYTDLVYEKKPKYWQGENEG